jgi:hypothetical protein
MRAELRATNLAGNCLGSIASVLNLDAPSLFDLLPSQRQNRLSKEPIESRKATTIQDHWILVQDNIVK